MSNDKGDEALAIAGGAGIGGLWLGFGVIELMALFATWGTGHFWAALFFPPYGLWVTLAWLVGLPPFPLE
jgi:hypothetical protein